MNGLKVNIGSTLTSADPQLLDKMYEQLAKDVDEPLPQRIWRLLKFKQFMSIRRLASDRFDRTADFGRHWHVHATYVPAANLVNIPLGGLMNPLFHPDTLDAFNYGALGVHLAHALSHAFGECTLLFWNCCF